MLDPLLGLLPVFGLIALGAGLRRARFLPPEGWSAVERLNYWVLFPPLLFLSIATAEISGGEALRLGAAFLIGGLAVALAVTLARPLMRLPGPSYSSLFQAGLRWNSYVALGVVAAVFGPPGIAVAAVAFAVLVPMNNVLSILVLSRHAGAAPAPARQVARELARNPLIIATLSGALLLGLGIGLPGPLAEGLKLLSQATIALGLLCVGAALDLTAMRGAAAPLAGAAVLRLALAPAVTALACLALGVGGRPFAVAVVCIAAPVTTSSYILAKQLGGDATLMANIVTLTTLLSAATLPAIIWLLSLAPAAG